MDKEDLSRLLCTVVEVQEIIALRHKVLRPGYPIETASFDGDNDPLTYHFAAFLPTRTAGSPVCCVSYMLNSHLGTPAWQLRGMATDPVLKGQGIGKELVKFAEQNICSKTGIKLFWCNARTEAIGFYEKQGWDHASEEFPIPHVGPHIIMTKQY